MTKRMQLTFFLLVAFLVYLSFGLYHLAKFETADERYWMYEDPENGRIHSYWNAIGDARWKDTYINDKPGVSLAYVSGIALLFKDKPAENLFSRDALQRKYNPQEVDRVHFLFRLPLLIFNGLLCLSFFWLIGKFSENRWIALWSTIFILLSPILLGISQIVNPDSLLWSFSAGAIFSFLSYLKVREKKFIFLTAIFLGFSLLSKYSAIIFIPFFLVAILVEMFFSHVEKKTSISSEVGSMLKAYLAVIAGAVVVFSIFLPAVFVHPTYLYQAFVALDGFRYVIMAIGGCVVMLLFDLILFKSRVLGWFFEKLKFLIKFAPKLISALFFLLFAFVIFSWMADVKYSEVIMRYVPFDMERGLAFQERTFPVRAILEFVPLLFSLTPLTLFFALFILGKSSISKLAHSKEILIILLFLVAFYSAVLLQGLLVTIRYSIVMYPMMLVLAGIGLWELFSWGKLQMISKAWVTLGVLAISVASLYLVRPFYFNYTSSLLPKSRIIADAWGYGGFEAAEFLNELPNAQDLLIWTDYNGYCPFLKGRCIIGKSNGKFKFKNDDVIPDYFIKTRRGTIMYRDMWDTINARYLYEKKDPVWELVINGRAKNYVKVYKYVPGNVQ